MNILLVNPPNCGRSIPEEHYGIASIKMIFRGEPLSLETLAGNLQGHPVAIVDLKADPLGLSPERLPFTPDVIGLTGVTCEANTVLAISEELKARFGAVVVVGGHHASCDPGFFKQPLCRFRRRRPGQAQLQATHRHAGDGRKAQYSRHSQHS